MGGIGFFIFIIYATVKTKSTGLNSCQPFKELIGKTVVLNKETYLFSDHENTTHNADFPYTLMDDLHPLWSYYQECKNLPHVDITEITSFPRGTKFQIKKAVQYTAGVSGASYPTLFGSIQHKGQLYKVSYQWGKQDFYKASNEAEKYWVFHQAPWQNTRDTASYVLPTANFW